LLDPAVAKRLYRAAVDQSDNLLIVTADESIHERIKWLRAEMDVETKRPGSAIKFYRIKFAAAQDILNTLRAMDHPAGNATSNQMKGVMPVAAVGASPASVAGGGAGTPTAPASAPNGMQNSPAAPMSPLQSAGPSATSTTIPGTPDNKTGQTTIIPGAARVS